MPRAHLCTSNVIACEAGTGTERLLLEFQGRIEGKNWNTDDDTPIGRLVFEDEGATPIMLIGRQRLVGRRVKLQYPFAVLEADYSTDINDTIMNEKSLESNMDTEQSLVTGLVSNELGLGDVAHRQSSDSLDFTKDVPEETYSKREFRFTHIIWEKIIFETRPETVFEH